MSDTKTAFGNERHYDLYLSAGFSLHWSNPNLGVTLTDDTIAWTIDDNPQAAKLGGIASIRLETGGTGDNIVAMCQISFVDGDRLTVLNSGGNGLPDSAQAPLYRDFVSDLHRRLAASRAQVDYVAGYTQGRYRFGIVVATMAGLFFFALPLVLLLITRESKALFLLIGGFFLVWPVIKLMRANQPQAYDPANLPTELLL